MISEAYLEGLARGSLDLGTKATLLSRRSVYFKILQLALMLTEKGRSPNDTGQCFRG